MTAYQRIRKTYQTYVGTLRLILADESLHLNDLYLGESEREQLQNEIQCAQMNMNELMMLAARDPKKFENDFQAIASYGDVIIWDVFLTANPECWRRDSNEEIC